MGVTLAHLITGASDDRLTAPISDPVSQPSHPTNPRGHTDHQERHTQERLARFNRDLSGYIRLHSTRPQALAFAMTDSPAGLLAWIAEKFAEWTDPGDRRADRQHRALVTPARRRPLRRSRTAGPVRRRRTDLLPSLQIGGGPDRVPRTRMGDLRRRVPPPVRSSGASRCRPALGDRTSWLETYRALDVRVELLS